MEELFNKVCNLDNHFENVYKRFQLQYPDCHKIFRKKFNMKNHNRMVSQETMEVSSEESDDSSDDSKEDLLLESAAGIVQIYDDHEQMED